jgi:transcriptional regulator with XRE-family HTH domain
MEATVGKRQQIEINERLGKRIRSIRKYRGLSQTYLADALGVSFQQVGKYESGENTMAVPAFLVICKALDIKPSFLLDNCIAHEKSH